MCRLAVQLSYLIQLYFVRDMFPTTNLNKTVVPFSSNMPPIMKRSDSQCIIDGLTFRLSFPTNSLWNTLGLPSSWYTSTHMPRLDNPADSPHPHHGGCFAWTSSTLQLWSVETNLFSGRCQHFRITAIPMAYALLCLRFTCFVRGLKSHSATGARLDTGGWLDLTRQGLSPCKVHQAVRCERSTAKFASEQALVSHVYSSNPLLRISC